MHWSCQASSANHQQNGTGFRLKLIDTLVSLAKETYIDIEIKKLSWKIKAYDSQQMDCSSYDIAIRNIAW